MAGAGKQVSGVTDLYWEDSTNAAGLQPGMYGYAGYYNGPFANLTAIRQRFPGKPVMGYATRIVNSHGADAIDCEPGTLGPDFTSNAAGAVTFVKEWTGGASIFSRPLVYCMASWLRSMEDYLASHGIPRTHYWMNSSHATGSPHYCGPSTCGYGRSQADLTQYEFAGGFDRTIMHSLILTVNSGPAPPPAGQPPPVIRIGATGKPVVTLRVHLDAWGAGLPANADGGTDVFGTVVDAAVRAFQHDHHLVADGVVGPLTWAAVLAAPPVPVPPAPPPPPPPPPVMPVSILRLGSTGADVKTLQGKLAGSGLPGVRGIVVDGTFGQQTDNSVRNLQSLKGLRVDGVVGPRTWHAVWTL